MSKDNMRPTQFRVPILPGSGGSPEELVLGNVVVVVIGAADFVLRIFFFRFLLVLHGSAGALSIGNVVVSFIVRAADGIVFAVGRWAHRAIDFGGVRRSCPRAGICDGGAVVVVFVFVVVIVAAA
jgi:hypothetical protein